MPLSTSSFSLASLASLAAASLVALVALVGASGCAADTTDPSNADETQDPGTSQDDLTSRAAQFAGAYSWRAGDSGDFEQLTLKANGSYTAKVDAGLVNPAVRCIAFPCTTPRVGHVDGAEVRQPAEAEGRPHGSEAVAQLHRDDQQPLAHAQRLALRAHELALQRQLHVRERPLHGDDALRDEGHQRRRRPRLHRQPSAASARRRVRPERVQRSGLRG